MKSIITALPAVLLALLPVTAFAQYEDKTFEELMQTGVQLYNQGKTNPINYKNALEAFRQARRIDPDDHLVTYNIARTFHRLGDCPEALNNYLWYQSAAIIDEDYRDVSDAVGELSRQCGVSATLSLKCYPANTMVSIDGDVAMECNGTHKLMEGSHEIVYFANGYDAKSEIIDVRMNDNLSRSIVLELASELKEIADRPDLLDRSLLWSGVAASSVGLISMVVGASLMLTSYENTSPADEELLNREFARDDTKHKAGVVATAVGGAVSFLGICFILADAISTYRADRKRIEVFEESFSIRPTLGVTGDSANAGLQITF